ncbi:MAG: pyridoxal phosphate-dependent aminotransferase [Rhizobiaceae bacterium]
MDQLTTTSITERLASLGGEKWVVHYEARRRVEAGENVIELTIGEPDIPTPTYLIDVANTAMRAGRTRYSGGKGEAPLLAALATKYSARTNRTITAGQTLALPGTQAALAICMMALVEQGDAVLVPDPYYVTYEGVVRATGAEFIPVPMEAANGFHLTAKQVETAITPNTKVLLLNSPHNPTGAVLSASEIAAIGAVCKKHNIWILSDEVYEQLIYKGSFASPFDQDELAENTIVVSSISKSHAAPGFRSGWCIGPEWVIDRVQSVAESILFGNQPFIADMTTYALNNPDDTASRMSAIYQRRIELLMDAFSNSPKLKPMKPAAGMFMLVDVTATGMNGVEFSLELLDHGVAVMPGNVFGEQADNLIRISLTVSDEKLAEAVKRMIEFANTII